MNQQWRRNIKKADKAGVGRHAGRHDATSRRSTTSTRTPPSATTSRRGRSAYFRTMAEAMAAEEPDRFVLWLAHHEGDLVAATVGVRVGTHSWYSYGASSTEKRDVRGSNAVQWAMMRDALAAGAGVYDLRGITDTLDPDDPHAGLIQFKVGTGGEAVEYVGEWDLPLRPLLYKAFQVAMSRAMSLTLTVDGDRWRTHLKRVAGDHPGLVPVAKGNGYGFGLGRLARKADWLGVDTLAVGTYDELPEVASRFSGDLLVLTPWRPFGAAARRRRGDPVPRDPHAVAGRGRAGAGRARAGRPVRARAAHQHAAPRPDPSRPARGRRRARPATAAAAGSAGSRCTCRWPPGRTSRRCTASSTRWWARGWPRPEPPRSGSAT